MAAFNYHHINTLGSHSTHFHDESSRNLLPKPSPLGIMNLPPGLPTYLDGASAWSGSDSEQVDFYHLLLDEDDVREVENAVEAFKELEMNGDDVSRELFPLPRLESRLDKCALEVHHGAGWCVIRGIDPHRYSVEDNAIIYLGISSYIGGKRGLQDAKGSMLSHVTDSKLWTTPHEKRHGIHTNRSLPFHCDMGSDILSINFRQTAQVGGRLCISSSSAIYNDLAMSDPSVIQTLATADWPIQASLKQRPPYTLSPLLEYHEGNFMLSMDPARIGLRATPPGRRPIPIPPLTLEQSHALQSVQESAQRHQLCLENQPGDMVYLNSWNTLHAREAYQDGETWSRHLIRLWLHNETLGWSVPPSMKMPWDSAFGVKAKEVINRNYPLAPMPVYMESRYTNNTAAFVPDDDDDLDDDNLDDDSNQPEDKEEKATTNSKCVERE